MRIEIEYHLGDILYEKGMSYKQLADLSGVSKTTIFNIVNQKKHPTLLTLYMIAYALEIPVKRIFSVHRSL